jgi:hypothetical protein
MAIEVTQNLTQVTISTAGVAGRSGFDGTSGTSGVNGTSGVSINSGSFLTTASFNSFTGSLNEGHVWVGGNGILLEIATSSFTVTSDVDNSSTNWNKDREYIIRNTEQLTFSGDYILEDCALLIEGSDEEVEYSANKSFKREGTIFIGGNLLLKDSGIQNDGKISVGGEVILIGNSQIVGNGIII